MFSFVVGQVPASPAQKTPALSFATTAVNCQLVYDHNCQKIVDGITQKPMEYKLVPLADGSQLRVDARIRVLSSQLGGSLFRVLVQLLDKDRNPIPDLAILSHPVRVRSKIKTTHAQHSQQQPQQQLQKAVRRPSPTAARHQEKPAMKRARQAIAAPAAATKAAEEPAEALLSSEGDEDDDMEELLGAATAAGTAHTSTALVMRALARIEKRQQQQQQFLDNLAVVASTPKRMLPQTPSEAASLQSSCATPEEALSDFQLTSPVDARLPQQQPQQVAPFSVQLLRLMDLYDGLSEQEKQEQLGLLQSAATVKQSQNMAAVLSFVASALPSQPPPLLPTLADEAAGHDNFVLPAFGDEDSSSNSSSMNFRIF